MDRPLPTRRQFAALAAVSLTAARAQAKTPPIGLQQTAVSRNIQEDLSGTLRAIAGMGYDIVEFSAGTWAKWSPAEAKNVRSQLDALKLRCRSTHNEIASFTGDGLAKALEINRIVGSDTIVSVRGPGVQTLDAWKKFNGQLSAAADRIRSAGMTLGFHNHDVEFKFVEGTRPIDLLAANKDIASFHLNLGLCLKGGGDPIAFIRQCPGRIQSVLCQDFEGKARWKETFAAAEGVGGLQFYLIQRTDGLSLVPREGTDLLDFARKDLEYFRQLRSRS
jgi:sugar phosphate isomerase/epimerase